MNATHESAAVTRPPFGADRFLIYVMSFAGLIAVVFAAAGWLQLLGALVLKALGIDSGLSDSQMRIQASYDLASIVVGLTVWQAFWLMARKRIVKQPLERQALERRLFLAGVFAVTSVVVLIFAEHFIQAVFDTMSGGSFSSHLHDLLAPLTFILAFGAAWAWHARISWRERSYKSPDASHDAALYLLLWFALGFLFFGIQSVIWTAINDVNGNGQGWTGWIDGFSFLLAGGIVWGIASLYDQARRGRRRLRVAFLYINLAFAVGFSLQEGITIGSALLQRAFDTGFDWGFASDQLPYFVPAVAMWAFYWMVVRSQGSFVRPASRGEIPWPRRPAVAAFCLIGVVLTSGALMGLAWTGLQAIIDSPAYEHWWVTDLSSGLCELVVGAALWVLAWRLLRHAARRSPRERVAWERRWLLFAITALSGLGALAAIVAMVYLLFSRVLGAEIGANFLLNEAEAVVGLLVSGSILTYYGRIFLAERRDRVTAPSQLRVAVLVVPGSEPVIARLTELEGVQIEVAGYVDARTSHNAGTVVAPAIGTDVRAEGGSVHTQNRRDATLAGSSSQEDVGVDSIVELLDRARSQGIERAWLVLSHDCSTLYPYTRSPRPAPNPVPSNPIRRPIAGTT